MKFPIALILFGILLVFSCNPDWKCPDEYRFHNGVWKIDSLVELIHYNTNGNCGPSSISDTAFKNHGNITINTSKDCSSLDIDILLKDESLHRHYELGYKTDPYSDYTAIDGFYGYNFQINFIGENRIKFIVSSYFGGYCGNEKIKTYYLTRE